MKKMTNGQKYRMVNELVNEKIVENIVKRYNIFIECKEYKEADKLGHELNVINDARRSEGGYLVLYFDGNQAISNYKFA